MPTYALIIMVVCSSVWVLGVASALLLRWAVIRKYGKVPKPEVLKRIRQGMHAEQIVELFVGELLKRPSEECDGDYIWQEEVPGRGMWTFHMLYTPSTGGPRRFSWGPTEYRLDWTIRFESYETRYLTSELHYLYPFTDVWHFNI